MRQPSRGFYATAMWVSFIAAVAAAVTVALSLKIFAMFIGWTCFGTGAGDIRRGSAATACLLIGLLLGMGSIPALGLIGPSMGVLALPAVVFVLAAVAMAALLMPPLDSVPGYFLGMTAYYASGLQPGTSAFIHLGGAALIGAAGSALLCVGPALRHLWRRCRGDREQATSSCR